MNIFKKINRNAFNEKLVHRYLFERYYFGTATQRKKLLPTNLHPYKINLIVPEDSKADDGYRADLTIYFKKRQLGIPVEVKWLLDSFTKRNQIDFLRKNNGFVVILGDTNERSFEGIDVVSIDHDDFSDWIAENISRLSRESLIYQAKSKKLSVKNQYWIVFIKGAKKGTRKQRTAIENFDEMLKIRSNYPFWAFRQHSKSLPHILDMQRGDKILFIFGKSSGMAQPKDPRTNIKVFRYYICNIIEPYYMALDKKRGCFFEKSQDLEINNRRWPHFIDFEIKKKYNGDTELNFGKQGEFSEAFSKSYNYGGGVPYPLSRAQFEKLKDYLFKLVANNKKA